MDWAEKYEWECFCDEVNFHKWAVRPVGVTGWGEAFHVGTQQEANDLVTLLSRHPSKREEVMREALELMFAEYKKQAAIAEKNES